MRLRRQMRPIDVSGVWVLMVMGGFLRDPGRPANLSEESFSQLARGYVQTGFQRMRCEMSAKTIVITKEAKRGADRQSWVESADA
jgi:hypothetical protein